MYKLAILGEVDGRAVLRVAEVGRLFYGGGGGGGFGRGKSLVADAVAVLLDGLDGGLDDGGLGNLADGGKSVGSGGGDSNGGGGGQVSSSIGQRSSGVSEGSSGVSEGCSGVSQRGSGVTGSQRDKASLGSDGQDSKNNLEKGESD
jgi:hypothetical protein